MISCTTKWKLPAVFFSVCLFGADCATAQNLPNVASRSTSGSSLEDLQAHLEYGIRLLKRESMKRTLSDDQQAFEAMGMVNGVVIALRTAKYELGQDTTCSDDEPVVIYAKVASKIASASARTRTQNSELFAPAVLGVVYPCLSFAPQLMPR